MFMVTSTCRFCMFAAIQLAQHDIPFCQYHIYQYDDPFLLLWIYSYIITNLVNTVTISYSVWYTPWISLHIFYYIWNNPINSDPYHTSSFSSTCSAPFCSDNTWSLLSVAALVDCLPGAKVHRLRIKPLGPA